jgi:hypothetical protein
VFFQRTIIKIKLMENAQLSSIVIVSGSRTAMGGFQGSLSALTAPELGAAVSTLALRIACRAGPWPIPALNTQPKITSSTWSGAIRDIKMSSIVIVSGSRTAMGGFQGSLSALTAPGSGTLALRIACRAGPWPIPALNTQPKITSSTWSGIKMSSIVIVSGSRTAMGGFQGSLSALTAPELGAAT